jgi:hypothetical protein
MIDAAMVTALFQARTPLMQGTELRNQIDETIKNVLTVISKTAQSEAILQEQRAKDLVEHSR